MSFSLTLFAESPIVSVSSAEPFGCIEQLILTSGRLTVCFELLADWGAQCRGAGDGGPSRAADVRARV